MHNTIRVAIQGDRGSFHEIAAHKYYTYPVTLIYCESFEQVFATLRDGAADKIFVAIRNSDHGEIEEVKHLIATSEVKVEGEYLLPIEQHIIGFTESSAEAIKTVISHPIALSQSSLYMQQHFAHASVVNYHDTAAAVKYVKDRGDISIAAVGSEAAATLYGLKVLHRAIQNDPHNATLFKSLSAKNLSQISLML